MLVTALRWQRRYSVKFQLWTSKAENFSTRSLERLFTKATDVFLDGTETIEDTIPNTCELHVMLEIDPCNGEPPSNVHTQWSPFIEGICKRLKQYPDDQRINFGLTFKNGNIFGSKPDVDYGRYLDKKESKRTKITKILSRINSLKIHTKHFSTLSLLKVFPWTQALELPDTEYISGILEETGFRISQKDSRIIGRTLSPHLRMVWAPKVTKIANAAFFDFIWLQSINDYDRLDCEEQPTIVCTPLPEDYFTQPAAPKNTHIF